MSCGLVSNRVIVQLYRYFDFIAAECGVLAGFYGCPEHIKALVSLRTLRKLGMK